MHKYKKGICCLFSVFFVGIQGSEKKDNQVLNFTQSNQSSFVDVSHVPRVSLIKNLYIKNNVSQKNLLDVIPQDDCSQDSSQKLSIRLSSDCLDTATKLKPDNFEKKEKVSSFLQHYQDIKNLRNWDYGDDVDDFAMIYPFEKEDEESF